MTFPYTRSVFLETLNTWNISEMLICKMTNHNKVLDMWANHKPQTNLNYFNFKLAFSLQCNKHLWCYLSAHFIAIYLFHLIGSQKGRIWSQKTSCRSKQTFQEKSTKVRRSGLLLSVVTWFNSSAYLSSPSLWAIPSNICPLSELLIFKKKTVSNKTPSWEIQVHVTIKHYVIMMIRWYMFCKFL